ELRVQFNKVWYYARVLNDLLAEEKERYKADIRATNILLSHPQTGPRRNTCPRA
ncbi:hypothetical protein Tco_0574488, partial [Tanacetum coccineum]